MGLLVAAVCDAAGTSELLQSVPMDASHWSSSFYLLLVVDSTTYPEEGGDIAIWCVSACLICQGLVHTM